MKRYKLLKDLPTFNKGDTFRLAESGDLVSEESGILTYAKFTLEKFNILDSGWFEEIPEEYKRWRAEKYGRYYSISDNGVVYDRLEINHPIDDHSYLIGNYFKTEEEAEKAVNWLKALTTLRDDTKGFKPNWKDGSQLKWSVRYDDTTDELSVSCSLHVRENIIFFATRDDAEESTKKHEREWLTYLNVEE